MKKVLIILCMAILFVSCSRSKSYSYESTLADNGAATAENTLVKGETVSKKVIRDANVDCETADAKDTYGKIVKWAAGNGGYEFSQNMTTGNEYSRINAVIKIDPDQLDPFLSYISEISTIINQKISAEDITEQYVDMELRMKTKRETLGQYYAMLKTAVNTSDIMIIQGKIDALTEEIEALQGKLDFWDKLVSESTVYLNVSEINDPERPKPVNFNAMSFDRMISNVGSGFMSVLNVLVSILQWIVIIVLAASPILVIGAGVLLIYFKVYKKRKK